MQLVASVHPSVGLFVCLLPSAATSNWSHYQSKVFVCNQWAHADNRADAVGRLLIWFWGKSA